MANAGQFGVTFIQYIVSAAQHKHFESERAASSIVDMRIFVIELKRRYINLGDTFKSDSVPST